MPRYQPLIIGVLVGGILGLMVWAAKRGRPKLDAETGVVWFRHSALFRGFSLFMGFGIPLAITALLLYKPPKNRTDVLAVIGLYALFGALSAPLVWESLRYALGISKDGLDCRSPWRASRFVPWNRVESLSYSTMNSWFIIHTKDRWNFRVSVFVPGLSIFLSRYKSICRDSKSCEGKARIFHGRKGIPEIRTQGKPWLESRVRFMKPISQEK